MNRFETEYQRLNKEQRQAVDAIDGPVLVVAGPGTGKTQLLSLRVANILKQTDVQAYNVLCLTYTESGKEAMVSRLTNFLGPAAKKVEVHTFHGFGTRLITRFPDFFPELANFRAAEDLTLYETLRACLEALPRKNPLSKHAYGQYTYQADAKDRISQLKRAGITPETASQKAATDLAWCRSTGSKIAKSFETAGRLTPKVIDVLAKNLSGLATVDPDSELGKLCNQQLLSAIQESQASGKTAALSAFKKQWLSSEDGKLYFKPIDQMKKLAALTELYASYETELQKRQLFDYDDMILYALEKLQNNTEFLALVQENFQYILADEYQDTNAAQASIINMIANNPVNEGRPNVMAVGDDDQAIYGFQGALGDVLIDFRERWRNVKVVILKNNYRSTESILDTARQIITQGQKRLENQYEDIDKSLLSASVYANVNPYGYETNSAQAVLDRAVQSAKTADPKHQLAFIATKHKYLRDLSDRLDAAKIKYYYEGNEDLLNDESLSKLLLLSSVVLAIKQKQFIRTNYIIPQLIGEEVLEIPRSLAWQIAITAKTKKQDWWQTLKAFDQDEVKKVVAAIKSLKEVVNVSDAEESLKNIAKVSGLRVIQKVQHLIKHARKYYGRNEIGLSELLGYVDLCRQAGIKLESKVIKGKLQAPVVLLSAHGSKGLEFDRVYLLHADYRTWFKERGRRNNLTLPSGWSSLEPLAADTDDKLRLLYVVMTRAKQELVLVKDKAGQAIPGLEAIKVEPFITEQLELYDLPEQKVWRDWYLPTSDKEKALLKTLLQPTLDSYRLSPTHLTMFLDLPHGGPANFLTAILLGILEPVHPEAIFGSLVHRSLRFAQDHLNKTGQLPSQKDLEKFVKSEAANWTDTFADDIVQVVQDFISHNNILQAGGVSEYSFSSQDIKLEDIPLTGIVDQYVNNNGGLTVVDFKTGRALNSWRVTEDYYKQKLHRFRQQLLFYELLFRLSAEFEIGSITSKIVFVEPSRRDVYYQLTLDTDHKEQQRLQQLISAVWQHLMVLSLPATNQYSLDAQGIQDFEDDLIAGEF